VDTARRRARYRALFRQNVPRRLAVDRVMRGVVLACVIVAIVPLGSILAEVIANGAQAISIEFLTAAPGAVGSGEGGVGPAIQGTLVIVGLTCLLGVPVGIMAGIYLAEYGRGRLAGAVRFFTDVFMEFPSIVMGIFAFFVVVLVLGHFSAWAGAFALSLIMFPIIARTTEESMRLVQHTYREAGMALGLKKWAVTVRIVMAAARGGLVTGILLSVSRVAGETAPLIMTILGSSQFFGGFGGPVDALPLRIWRLSLLPYDSAQLYGWGSALVLITMILVVNVCVRYALMGGRASPLGMLARRRAGARP